MLKKAREARDAAQDASAADSSKSVLESSRQIWLAGLGAFSRAQAEGMKVFEDRVARALARLGVHTQTDVERLSARVDALAEAVNELIKASGGTPVKKSRSSVGSIVHGAVSTATRTATSAAGAVTNVARNASGVVSTAGKTAKRTANTARKVARAALK